MKITLSLSKILQKVLEGTTFLTHTVYAKTHVFGQGYAFWGSQQYPTTFTGQLAPQKKPPQNGQE